MTNKLISATVKGLHNTPLLATLLFFLFTGLLANAQTYEFESSLRAKGSFTYYNLIIDQSLGTVKVTTDFYITSLMGSIEDVDLDTKIGIILLNENSEIVIGDSNDEFIAAVYVNNSGTDGYFIYKSNENGGFLKIKLPSPKDYLTTFKKLKQAVESDAFNKSTTKNRNGSASGVTASSSGRLPAKGAKTADILATHPFGFLPPNCLSESEIKKAMKEEGWPEANWYRADLNFKVPYTIYGTKVWSVDWGFNNGQLSRYKFDTYEMTGNVTDKRILDYVGLFLSDLKKIGYELKSYKPDKTASGTYHRWNLSNGNNDIEITTNLRGKVFFAVWNLAKK